MDTATIENPNNETAPRESFQTRKLKVVLPQCYAALAIFAVNLSYVTFENTIFHVAMSLVTYGFIKWIGLLIGGIVAQITGARVIVMLTGVTLAVSWIFFEWIFSNEILQWILFIVPMTGGMMQAPAYVYLAEISQPNMRSALMALMCLSANIGTVYLDVFAGEGTMRITACINVVFAFFGLVVMYFLPDSPYQLANKGRYRAVESSLAWFRGQTSVENVNSESNVIIGNAQNSSNACKLFCQKSLYMATLIVGYVFAATASVKIFFVTFSSSVRFILRDLGYHESTDRMVSEFFGISTVFTSIAFVVLVAIIGKRLMILISVFSGSIAIIVASIAFFLNNNHILSTDAYSWSLLICFAVTYFSLITGVGSVPLLLNGELFPAKLRYFGTGLGLFLMETNLYTYFYINYLLIAPDALLILAIASIIGFISLIWLFPRNDNKSLVEIEHSSTELCTSLKKKISYCVTKR